MQAGEATCGAGRAKMLGIFLLMVAATSCVFGQSKATGSIAIVNGMCPPGYYKSIWREEFPCHPCDEGTYTSGPNNLFGCIMHRRCGDLEVNTFAGNSTANAVCQCQPGLQRFFPYNITEQYTFTCSPCPNGTVLMQVPDVPGLVPGDTICCKPEETPVVTEEERACKLLRRASLTGKEDSTVPPSDEYRDSDDLVAYILAGVTTAIAAICAISGIVIHYGRHHPESWCGKITPCCRARADHQPEVACGAEDIQEISL